MNARFDGEMEGDVGGIATGGNGDYLSSQKTPKDTLNNIYRISIGYPIDI